MMIFVSIQSLPPVPNDPMEIFPLEFRFVHSVRLLLAMEPSVNTNEIHFNLLMGFEKNYT